MPHSDPDKHSDDAAAFDPFKPQRPERHVEGGRRCREGRDGTVKVRNGAYRGRYLVDVPGQVQRQTRSVVLGFVKGMTKTEAKRKMKEFIRQKGIDLPTYVILPLKRSPRPPFCFLLTPLDG